MHYSTTEPCTISASHYSVMLDSLVTSAVHRFQYRLCLLLCYFQHGFHYHSLSISAIMYSSAACAFGFILTLYMVAVIVHELYAELCIVMYINYMHALSIRRRTMY